LQQFAGIFANIAVSEYRIAGNQQIGSGAYNVPYGG
jgi:hypothetical protein